LGSPYGRCSAAGGGSDSGVNGGGAGYANSDYAAPTSRHGRSGGGDYSASLRRSASQGDSGSSTFTPAIGDENRLIYHYLPQKSAGVNAFPVSPADTRLSSWAANASSSPGGGGPGSEYSTRTTSYKRLYESSVSKRTTANGQVTFNESQQKREEQGGNYYD